MAETADQGLTLKTRDRMVALDENLGGEWGEVKGEGRKLKTATGGLHTLMIQVLVNCDIPRYRTSNSTGG
jgi:hypothetical protein